MPVLRIIMDGDNCWPDLRPGNGGPTIAAHVKGFEVAALAGGMSSGKPSVMLRIDLPSGEAVLAETSLALFLSAADAFKARYGDPRIDSGQPPGGVQ